MDDKIIIGIDPDINVLSLAIVWPRKENHIFFCRNKYSDSSSAVDKLATASHYISDVCQYLCRFRFDPNAVELFVEHQNMQHAAKAKTGRTQDMITQAHLSGLWIGTLVRLFCFKPIQIHNVMAITWKGNQPKRINQARTLDYLEILYEMSQGKDPYPKPSSPDIQRMCLYSPEQPNPGDFKDINDSLGLAVHGHKTHNRHNAHRLVRHKDYEA